MQLGPLILAADFGRGQREQTDGQHEAPVDLEAIFGSSFYDDQAEVELQGRFEEEPALTAGHFFGTDVEPAAFGRGQFFSQNDETALAKPDGFVLDQNDKPALGRGHFFGQSSQDGQSALSRPKRLPQTLTPPFPAIIKEDQHEDDRPGVAGFSAFPGSMADLVGEDFFSSSNVGYDYGNQALNRPEYEPESRSVAGRTDTDRYRERRRPQPARRRPQTYSTLADEMDIVRR